MPLDEVGQRYAHTLYVDKLEELSKKHARRMGEIRSDFAARGTLAERSGAYFSEITRAGIQYVEELANAIADSRLTAYQQAGLPIDREAVTDIHRAAIQLCDNQGRNLAANVRQQVAQAGAPANVADAIASRIESAMAGTKARILRKLSAVRDEQIMAARQAPRPAPDPAPQPEVPMTKPPRTDRNVLIDLWHGSGKWPWYSGFFAGAFLMIPIQEYLFSVLLLVLAALSLLSKLLHNKNTTTQKSLGSIGILAASAIFLYIIVAVEGRSPWSHLQEPLIKLIGFTRR